MIQMEGKCVTRKVLEKVRRTGGGKMRRDSSEVGVLYCLCYPPWEKDHSLVPFTIKTTTNPPFTTTTLPTQRPFFSFQSPCEIHIHVCAQTGRAWLQTYRCALFFLVLPSRIRTRVAGWLPTCKLMLVRGRLIFLSIRLSSVNERSTLYRSLVVG